MAVTDCIRQCRRCGVEFRRTAKGQPTKYCGEACRVAASERRSTVPANCITCDASFYPRHDSAGFCSMACRRMPAFIGPRNKKKWKPGTKRTRDALCACCGCRFSAAYLGGRTGQFASFCSSACRAKGRKQAIAKLLSEARIVVSLKRRQCETCSKTFASSLGKYCSDGCRPEYGQWEQVERACACCAVLFTIERKWQRACSDACELEMRRRNRRKDKSKRRARLRMLPCESIDPIEVFDRDGWQCQLCGIETPRELRGTYHPQAPELDHVMPLALGGGHTWANVQCACRHCNHTKGASLPAEARLAA